MFSVSKSTSSTNRFHCGRNVDYSSLPSSRANPTRNVTFWSWRLYVNPWVSLHRFESQFQPSHLCCIHSALPEGQMLMYFHFKPGDLIWFLGWVPSSTGAMVGASIGLFLFAVFERWVSALKALMEAHWRSRYGDFADFPWQCDTDNTLQSKCSRLISRPTQSAP